MSEGLPDNPQGDLTSYIPWAITGVVSALSVTVATLYGFNLKLMLTRIDSLETDVKSGKEHIKKLEDYRVECESDRSALRTTCDHLSKSIEKLQLQLQKEETSK
jgi:chromosome segregation ATPase